MTMTREFEIQKFSEMHKNIKQKILFIPKEKSSILTHGKVQDNQIQASMISHKRSTHVVLWVKSIWLNQSPTEFCVYIIKHVNRIRMK